MKVTIQAFAILKEKLGETVNIELNEKSTVDDILMQLQKLFPDDADLIAASRISSDKEIFRNDTIISKDQSVLFILPPSSGG